MNGSENNDSGQLCRVLDEIISDVKWGYLEAGQKHVLMPYVYSPLDSVSDDSAETRIKNIVASYLKKARTVLVFGDKETRRYLSKLDLPVYQLTKKRFEIDCHDYDDIESLYEHLKSPPCHNFAMLLSRKAGMSFLKEFAFTYTLATPRVGSGLSVHDYASQVLTKKYRDNVVVSPRWSGNTVFYFGTECMDSLIIELENMKTALQRKHST